MKQRLNVIRSVASDNELLLITDSTMNLGQLSPSGQMLVDSDKLAFIYIADLNGEYTYVTIPVETWAMLNEALQNGLNVYAANENSRIQLQGFKEEMDYLIENIKGNSNYGEEMVSKVESFFK